MEAIRRTDWVENEDVGQLVDDDAVEEAIASSAIREYCESCARDRVPGSCVL